LLCQLSVTLFFFFKYKHIFIYFYSGREFFFDFNDVQHVDFCPIKIQENKQRFYYVTMFINEIKRAVDVLNHTHTFFSPLIVSRAGRPPQRGE
jgi:hypothetical protein